MPEALPPLILEIRARADQLLSELKKAKSATKDLADETGKNTKVAAGHLDKMASAGKALSVGIIGVAATAGGAALKLGMDFQESMTSLVTGAGESQKNIGAVGNGILSMAGKVGISASNLASGMYLVESAGYHGGQGLSVLQAAAEGARVGAANMTDVANGLTTALTDYHIPATQAASVTSALVQTVADGKTHLGDLANSLGNVMPLAAQLGVKFQDVAGGIAAMTNQGMTADNASQNLNHLIGALGADTLPKAAKALTEVGLSGQQLNDGLKKGLPQTLQLVADAVGKKFPAGSAKYMDAMRKILGGQPGLDAALMLSGKNMVAYKANVENIGEKLAASSKHVEGFAETQKDLKTKLENARAGVSAMVTKLGMALIPVVTSVMEKVAAFGALLTAHKPILYTVAGIIGGVVVTAIGAYIGSLVAAGVKSVITFAKMLASGVAWAATQAAQFAEAVASGAVWVAQHIAMAAVAVVQYGIIAASATAAFIAENLATLGIIAGIALVIAAVVFLATHWTQVWGVIKAVVGAVWDFFKGVVTWIVHAYIGVIKTEISILGAIWGAIWHGIQAAVSAVWGFLKGVFSWVVGTFMAGIRLYIGALGAVWGAVWGGIKSVVSGVWGFLKGVWGFITGGLKGIGSAASGLGSVWSSIWNGIKSAVSAAWSFISPIVNTIKGAIGGVMGAVHGIGSAASSVGHFLGFANGGIVPGPTGAPRLAVVHGGEAVLSNDMLAGKQAPPPEIMAATTNAHGYTSQSASALNGSSSSAPGVGNIYNTTINAQTNASPRAIASEFGWAVRSLS